MSYQFQQWWAKTGHALWRDHKFTHAELARRAYAEGTAAAIPPGWKPVPMEPTEAMLDAGEDFERAPTWRTANVYRAMVAAAPTPPAQGE